MNVYPFKNAVTMSHMFLQPYASQAKLLVDMTCGNGHDTAFLASCMPDTAVLYAFDIQACAVEATKKTLQEQHVETKHIICQQGSHDVLLERLDGNPNIIVFNLGYLPSGDHAVHTKTEITLKAVKICLNKIAINGIIMIAAYPGTPAGAEEEEALRQFLQTVPQKEFDVSSWQPVNQIHCPPRLYIVQKRG